MKEGGLGTLSDEFKKKLTDYAEGKLSSEEKAEIERELEKLEEYQAFLEEELEDHRLPESEKSPKTTSSFIDKKGARIIKQAKWKARISNALTALGIIFAGTVLCGFLSSLYYTSGNPAKPELYRDIVRSAIAITEPNVQFRGGGTQVNLLTMDLRGELKKKIGSEEINAGEIQMSFLFNQAGYPERKNQINAVQTWPFRYPSARNPLNGDWEKLDKLPEGTVAEAYISFNNFYSTDQVLKKFKGKNMRPVWFVVDTGFDNVETNDRASFIGFPYEPLWHHDDMTVTNRKEEKWGFFGKTVSESASSPSVEDYGDAQLRNQNFLKTLELLKSYEKTANRIVPGDSLRITERIKYLKSHGVKIYGIVVTGPTKEILKLKDETWVAGLHLGEVRLWNWENN